MSNKMCSHDYPAHLVIGADTIVDLNGKIIGKPSDAKHAEEITKALFSSIHKVITAIAIIRLGDSTKIIESDVTIVYPRKLTDEQIKNGASKYGEFREEEY